MFQMVLPKKWTQQMAVRGIRTFPDPALLRKADPVKTVDQEIKTLVGDMIETMHAAPGIGLAAPQIGVNRRVIVVDPSAGEDPETILVLLNPVIISTEGKAVAEEGCLSLPEVQEEVERPEKIVLEALSLDGQGVWLEADGLMARILQHEIDHLDGILIFDKIGAVKRDIIKRKLRKRTRVEA
jgi:peptide deformylase